MSLNSAFKVALYSFVIFFIFSFIPIQYDNFLRLNLGSRALINESLPLLKPDTFELLSSHVNDTLYAEVELCTELPDIAVTKLSVRSPDNRLIIERTIRDTFEASYYAFLPCSNLLDSVKKYEVLALHFDIDERSQIIRLLALGNKLVLWAYQINFFRCKTPILKSTMNA